MNYHHPVELTAKELSLLHFLLRKSGGRPTRKADLALAAKGVWTCPPGCRRKGSNILPVLDGLIVKELIRCSRGQAMGYWPLPGAAERVEAEVAAGTHRHSPDLLESFRATLYTPPAGSTSVASARPAPTAPGRAEGAAPRAVAVRKRPATLTWAIATQPKVSLTLGGTWLGRHTLSLFTPHQVPSFVF